MADRLYTSLRTDEIISSLRAYSKLDKVTISKIAFTYSLVQTGISVNVSTNFSGGEMKRTSFLGNDELFIKSLIQCVYNVSEIAESDLYSNKSIIKNHIDNGTALIWELFIKNGDDINKWYLELLSTVKLTGYKKTKTKDLDIYIGRAILTNRELILNLNNTTKHANSHLAIMGKPGVGKTQFLLKLLHSW